MIHSHRTMATRTVLVLVLSVLAGCSAGTSDSKSEKKLAKQEKKREKQEKKSKKASENNGSSADKGDQTAATGGDASRFAATDCDQSLWNHVYNPSRLQKLAACVAVTGTVAESAADDDGDQHFLLKLDAGQEALVNQTNAKKKNGDLVVEIVCANAVSLPKAKSACEGYKNKIAPPAVGAHVRATGTYVIDSHNGWAEIHPVSKLQRL